MQVKAINPPINKSYISSFITNYIQMKFLHDKSLSLDSLKNLIFPSEYSETNFNEFVSFVDFVIKLYINKSLNDEQIKEQLISQNYSFSDELISTMIETLQKSKETIFNSFNREFMDDKTFLINNIDWNVKTIISSSSMNDDSNHQVRVADLELNLDDRDNKSKFLNLTMTKKDINKLNLEMTRIKENILSIKSLKN